jgi:hypothetical protein
MATLIDAATVANKNARFGIGDCRFGVGVIQTWRDSAADRVTTRAGLRRLQEPSAPPSEAAMDTANGPIVGVLRDIRGGAIECIRDLQSSAREVKP